MTAEVSHDRPPHDVDGVVEAVLRRLGGGSASGNLRQASLRLDARVISAACLPRSLQGVEEVVVAPGALLTPAARDRLAEARVRIRHGETLAVEGVSAEAVLPLAVVTRWNPAPLVADLARRGVTCELLASGGDRQAVAAVHAALVRAPRGVLVTDEPQIACCLANRDPRVRAATAARIEELDHLLEALGLNLLVLRPRGQSIPMTARLIERFAMARPAEEPAALAMPQK